MSSQAFLRALFVTTALCGGGVAAPALAQTAPLPLYSNQDANGVDLFNDVYYSTLTEGSIGSGDGAVSLVSSAAPDQWSGLLYRQTTGGVPITYVQIGSISDAFTSSGSTYVSVKGNGATLVALGGNKYRYTESDGTKVDYESTATQPLNPSQYVINGPGCSIADAGTCAIPTAITEPTGMVFTLGWTLDFKCGGTSFPCPAPKAWFRLASVTSTARYGMNIQYATNDPGSPSTSPNAPVPDWFKRTGATFTNSVSPPSPVPTVTYAFPSAGVEQITDSGGRTWTYNTSSGTDFRIRRPGSSVDNIIVTYGTGGKTASVSIDGVVTHYSSSDAGSVRTMTVTDGAGNVTTYQFDIPSQRLTKMTDALLRQTVYTNDSNGRVTNVSYVPADDSTQYAYDARGNVTQTTLVSKTPGTPANIVTSANYVTTCSNPVTCNSPTFTKDANGNQTDYGYDPTTGQLTSVTRPAPVTGGARPTTTYTYTSTSGVSELTGISTCSTAATCVGTVNETKATIGYNTNLLPSSVTKASGDGSVTATTAYTYDSIGNVLTVDGPLSGTADTITYRYDASRDVTGVIKPDPDGAGSLVRAAERLTYNGSGQVTETEIGTVTGTDDPSWAAFASKQQQTTTYDTNARKVADVVTAAGTTYGVTHYSYDTAGRPLCTTVRMNTTLWGTLTDACTAQTTGSAGPDRITKNAVYDALNRATTVTTAYLTGDASNQVVTYNLNGTQATIADGNNNLTSYSYDGFDRLTMTAYPLPSTPGHSSTTDFEQLGYDPNGNITSRRLRGYAADNTQHIDYTYDNLNRLTLKTLPGSELAVTYGYDLMGRLTTAATSAQTLTFGYDALSRMTSQGGPLGTMAMQYDAAGERTRLTWPDAFYVGYDYDSAGKMLHIRENGAASGIGVLATFAYNDLGRRTSLTRGNGTVTSYGYDGVSRLASLGHDLSGTAYDLTTTFGYNPASQIASATRSNTAYVPTASNRTWPYTLNGLNQITHGPGGAAGYDARGNLASYGGTYTYSSENLLLTEPGTTSFAYDPLLRLYQETTVSALSKMQYDGLDMVGEYDTYGTLQGRYVFGPGTDEPLVEYDKSGSTFTRAWLHADERGSIIAHSDDTGAETVINTYDEYGIPGSGNAGRFQFTGQTWLPGLGVYYYKSRFYSSRLGRFLQTDPIGYGDGPNWYNYVGGDPINFVDPTGTMADIISCYGVMVGGQCMSLDSFHRWYDQVTKETTPGGNQVQQTPDGGNTGPEVTVTANVPQSKNRPKYCASIGYRIGARLQNFGEGAQVLGGAIGVRGALSGSEKTAEAGGLIFTLGDFALLAGEGAKASAGKPINLNGAINFAVLKLSGAEAASKVLGLFGDTGTEVLGFLIDKADEKFPHAEDPC